MTTTPLRELESSPLLRWRAEARTANVAHLRATDSLNWRNFSLGAVAVMLAAATGTSVFATLQHDVTIWVRVVIATLIVVSAMLTALQTYMRYGSRAEAHQRASRDYGNVVREITEVLDAHLAATALAERTHAIRRELDKIDDAAPNVAPYLWSWAVNSCSVSAATGRDPSTIGRGFGPRLRWMWTHSFRGAP
jgi:hypothetical protein